MDPLGNKQVDAMGVARIDPFGKVVFLNDR